MTATTGLNRDFTESAIDRFFKLRESPTQSQCDDKAREISGGSVVHAANGVEPHAQRYEVLCTGRPHGQRDQIVIFQESEKSRKELSFLSLAETVHGDLVPRTTYHGPMSDSSPPLHIYSKPLMPGVSLKSILSSPKRHAEGDTRRVLLAKSLAR
ncbi:hypothetical protein BBP40_008743 [Aspergillus hancockii]|nr:hypothetical protein BBP40_008743 [Aspergillus hancockii]